MFSVADWCTMTTVLKSVSRIPAAVPIRRSLYITHRLAIIHHAMYLEILFYLHIVACIRIDILMSL